MKTIGIIGGMSFESTITYYKTINETINNQLGNLNSAKILLYSVNFEEIANLQKNGEWEKAAQILGECAKKLELGGADFILIATNTMHKIFDQIQKKYKNSSHSYCSKHSQNSKATKHTHHRLTRHPIYYDGRFL